jgi:hypothetical protein
MPKKQVLVDPAQIVIENKMDTREDKEESISRAVKRALAMAAGGVASAAVLSLIKALVSRDGTLSMNQMFSAPPTGVFDEPPVENNTLFDASPMEVDMNNEIMAQHMQIVPFQSSEHMLSADQPQIPVEDVFNDPAQTFTAPVDMQGVQNATNFGSSENGYVPPSRPVLPSRPKYHVGQTSSRARPFKSIPKNRGHLETIGENSFFLTPEPVLPVAAEFVSVPEHAATDNINLAAERVQHQPQIVHSNKKHGRMSDEPLEQFFTKQPRYDATYETIPDNREHTANEIWLEPVEATLLETMTMPQRATVRDRISEVFNSIRGDNTTTFESTLPVAQPVSRPKRKDPFLGPKTKIPRMDIIRKRKIQEPHTYTDSKLQRLNELPDDQMVFPRLFKQYV